MSDPNLRDGHEHEYVQGDHWTHVHYRLDDSGQVIQPGFSLAYNASGEPELVERSSDV